MIRKKRATGMSNMTGNRNNRQFLNCLLYPFSAYEVIIESVESNKCFETIEFLDKEFNTTTQIDEIKLFLQRFINIVKFDYNKDNRPPLRMRYNLEQKKIEILFDFNSKVLHEDEIQLKEELILDIVELEYRNNLLKLLNEGKISVDEFKCYMNELE
jgi:hypothetical protein